MSKNTKQPTTTPVTSNPTQESLDQGISNQVEMFINNFITLQNQRIGKRNNIFVYIPLNSLMKLRKIEIIGPYDDAHR